VSSSPSVRFSFFHYPLPSHRSVVGSLMEPYLVASFVVGIVSLYACTGTIVNLINGKDLIPCGWAEGRLGGGRNTQRTYNLVIIPEQ